MSDIVTGNFQDPMESFQNAFKFGAGIQQMQGQAQAAEQARKDAEAKAAAEADRQARLADFNAKLRNGTVTTQDYMSMAGDMSKDQNDAMQAGFKILDTEKQKAALKDTGELFAALQSGQKDVALSMMDNQIKAFENSGSTAEAQAMKMLRQSAEIDPLAVAGYFGTTLGRMGTEGKDILDNALKLQREGGQNKQGADISLTQAQTEEARARAAKAQAETDLLTANLPANKRQLNDKEREQVNKGVLDAVDADALQSQYSDLAYDFESKIKALPSGSAAKASELIKNILGTENTPTKLRQQYLKLRNTAAMKMLPPGSASDADVALALGAFPNENSNPELIAGFLRGMAKLKGWESTVSRSSSEWLAQNGSMGPAASDLQVNDRTVSKGTRFDQYIKGSIPSISSTTTEGQANLSGLKEYLKKNNPGSATAIDSSKSTQDLLMRYPNGVKAYQNQGGGQARQEVREVDF